MRLTAQGVGVDGAHGPLLEPTDVDVGSGGTVLVAGLPGSGHTALALTLAGRMRPSRGRMLVNGTDDPPLLRRRVAVVDTPGVSEPEPTLPLRTVVGEELAMAGRRAWPGRVRSWLDGRGVLAWSSSRFEDVPPAIRLELMVALAAARPDCAALVITAPDRHGGPPAHWWDLARDYGDEGYAVVVTCTEPSAALLTAPAVRLGGAGRDGSDER